MFPIPVSIITGFLGSGKTTLLNRLLKDPALKDTAVIINEFGDVGIDHLLVEQSGDGIIELADGCLCCTIRGELVDTLSGLIDRLQTGVTKNLSRVIIETTGLADPVPVLAALMAHPVMLQAFRIDGVITVVDAVNGEATLDNHAEAVKQVAVADRLVLAKTDMPESIGTLPLLEARLRKLNPAAPLITAQGGEASVAHLFNCGLYDPQTKTTDVARWLNDEAYGDSDHKASGSNHHGHAGSGHASHSVQHSHHHDVNRHDAAIRAFTLVHERPVPLAAVQMFFELLQSAHGDNLLRMKGVVSVLEHPERPLVIHGVQKVLHPPVRLPAWPGHDRRTRLVMITKDISETYIRRLFAAFAGEVAIDQPDAEALTNNPLAPVGLRT